MVVTRVYFFIRSKTVAMSSLALMHNLATWLFRLQVFSKFGHRRGKQLHLQGSKLRLTGRQCDQKSSVGDQLVASERLTFEPQRKTTSLLYKRYDICSKRSNKTNRGFFDHQLDRHILCSTFFILGQKSNNTSTVNPSFFFAVKPVNVSHVGKL